MPRYALFRMATLTGMRSADAVTSSWAVIWKHPSPSMAHTVRPGMPTLAPMAAGTAKPMVPSPPGVDPRVGVVEPPELARPHLVLADAGHDDRVLRRPVTQLLDAELRLQGVALVPTLVVAQGELDLPLLELGVPLRAVRLGAKLPHLADELGDDGP